MLNYHLECKTPTSQFVQIRINVPVTQSGAIKLQLPAWRAGRYYLANYAQNIRNFYILDQQNQPIPSKKTSKDAWIFDGKAQNTYTINYEYYAAQMDAGACWVDEEQVYINFINCCLEVKGMENDPIQFSSSLPQYPNQICTLEYLDKGIYQAKDYQELVDSTFLAAQQLSSWSYQVGGTNFNIWIHGAIHFDKEVLIDRFIKFTQAQINDFGAFPEKRYHFIFQLLPYKHYHGVEHKKGTVITFGPAESLIEESRMEELLGVSAHELYHAWNVCRIRPQELLPYDFSKENYNEAGWVLEGVTTYMGDLYLLKSGVFSLETYLKQLETIVNRNALSFGWKNHSILESSFDLWLDGYQQGIPDRKVSIYTHGALICCCLDLMLLKRGSSLPQVMRAAWKKFGKPNLGYSSESFWNLILHEIEDKNHFDEFYRTFIAGKNNVLSEVEQLVQLIGLELQLNQNPDVITAELGIILSEKTITRIHPDSVFYDKLMLGDKVSYQETADSLELSIQRINGKSFSLSAKKTGRNLYPTYRFKDLGSTELRELWKK